MNYSVSVGDNYYEVELTLEHYDQISLRIEWELHHFRGSGKGDRNLDNI